MERGNIIQSEVKKRLSDYGLNEEERKEYENFILEALKEKEFDKEEDFHNEVRTRIDLFIPSVKQLQKSRTKLLQEKADVVKQLEELRAEFNALKGEDSEDALPEDNNSKNSYEEEYPTWAKTMLEEFKSMKEEREAEKKEKELSSRKETILKDIKKDYSDEYYDLIDMLVSRVDFSKESAKEDCKKIVSDYATKHPAHLVKSLNPKEKKGNNPFLPKDKTDTKKRQEEFNKNLV